MDCRLYFVMIILGRQSFCDVIAGSLKWESPIGWAEPVLQVLRHSAREKQKEWYDSRGRAEAHEMIGLTQKKGGIDEKQNTKYGRMS